jgi:protoporphyrinogen oxidase
MKAECILVLGAGPSGMAAAFELYRAGNPFIIVEKSDRVGGLSKTLQYGDFRTDIGPHRFFSQNRYLYDFIEDLLGKRWIKVNRLTRFYIKGKFFIYPIDLGNALINVGPYNAVKIIRDFSLERVKKVFANADPQSFEKKVISDFGRTLAELNMLNYTEKIWGLPCSEISPTWADQRIKGLSLYEVLKKALIKADGKAKTLVDQFYYPDTGTSLIYDHINDRILSGENNSNDIWLKSCPVKIAHNDSEILDITIRKEAGEECKIRPQNVISSIPIVELVRLLDPSAPDEVLKAIHNLKFRSHISLFMTLKKSHAIPDQWIYFPDKNIPFARIMEPKNFSKKLSPPEETSLLIEFFCWENDHIWNASKDELLRQSVMWLEKLDFIKKEEIMESFVHRERYAYPVYYLNYEKDTEIIKNYLTQFKNLQSVGRAGTFRYNNQDHALEMGILAARSIIEGKKYDIDSVGSEQKYFERGYIK